MDIPNLTGNEFTLNDASSGWYRCVAMNIVRSITYTETSHAFQVNDRGAVMIQVLVLKPDALSMFLTIFRIPGVNNMNMVLSCSMFWKLLHLKHTYIVHIVHVYVMLCYVMLCYVMLCYMVICVKRLSQKSIQRRYQRNRLVKMKVFKLRRDADDIPCSIILRKVGGVSFQSAGPTTAKARF